MLGSLYQILSLDVVEFLNEFFKEFLYLLYTPDRDGALSDHRTVLGSLYRFLSPWTWWSF